MFDAHRHDEFSFYDGSGKAGELAKLAKEKGFTALGLTNHGNTSGLVQHYDACKAASIKPIMGVEAYFLPKYKEQSRGFHLCLFAKNLKGYENINRIQSEGELQKFYNPIVTFEQLQKYHEGVICSTACVAGFLAQCIIHGKYLQAKKFIKKMHNIFGEDFYVEIQPYVVSQPGVQEKVNVESIKLAQEFGVKCILTSDSHRGRKEDIEEYIKMHELKKSSKKEDKEAYIKHIRDTYSERYMPDLDEMKQRFMSMHKKDFGRFGALHLAKEMYEALEEFEAKVEDDILDQLAAKPSLPVFEEGKDSLQTLKMKVKQGLKDKNLYNKKYIHRAVEELKVIKSNEFQDYFLIVQEYTNWARENGIIVGPGRGSGCNCLVNFVLGITEVDPVMFNLDFRRFIREGKKSLPDIDIDFEPSRRDEVIEHIVKRYKGHAVQIASYGMYKVDNLLNELFKLYDVESEDQAKIKKVVNSYKDEEKQVNIAKMRAQMKGYGDAAKYNNIYSGILEAFCFLYNKVKYMGTHAAGVAVTRGNIFEYTAARYDKKNNKYYSSYNLIDMERIGVIKYDILGLNTLDQLKEYEKRTGDKPTVKRLIHDKKSLAAFRKGKSDAVFQFDSEAAKGILKAIEVDSFNDVVAANAMDRPGPLALGIPDKYANAKHDWEELEEKPVWAKYVDNTYGCILYQEQTNNIAVNYGGLDWNQADKLRKMGDPSVLKNRLLLETNHDTYKEQFASGLKKYGVGKKEAGDLFEDLLHYTFNQGHATGYSIISMYEMYYKVHYPVDFWATKLKYCYNQDNEFKFQCIASNEGIFLLTPHVNGTAKYSIADVEGERCILLGLSSIKGIGDTVAKAIEEERILNGPYKDIDDLCGRLPKRIISSKNLDALKEAGACVFDKKRYFDAAYKYNMNLYMKG